MKGNKLAGLLLIVFGVLYLGLQVLDQMGIVLFEFWDFWPLTIIGIGVIFEMLYFARKKSFGFLIPGGILTTIGLLHMFETLTNWHFAAYTWPFYTFAVFVGFFQVYMFTKQRWAMIVSLILFSVFTFLAMIAFSILLGGFANVDMAFSALIIIIGLILVTNAKNKKDSDAD